MNAPDLRRPAIAVPAAHFVEHSGYGREIGFEALYGVTTPKIVVVRHG